MDRLRNMFQRRSSYERLEGGSVRPDGQSIDAPNQQEFTWLDYSIFTLLGVAMLWAWNMFLAAGPYFQRRFHSNPWIYTNFQSTELSVFTITSLGSMLVLTKLQANASYPKRITASLLMNIAAFTLLAMSTRLFLGVSAAVYFAFFITMVLTTSLAGGLCQNGIFAYVSGFGREEYTQAIMVGQAIAGVLPCIAQIASVLSVPVKQNDVAPPSESSTSAFSYFLTASALSATTLVAFLYLRSRYPALHRRNRPVDSLTEEDGPDDEPRKAVPLLVLFRKLFWLANAVALNFGVTMVYPVYTQEIQSVRPPVTAPRLFQPSSFVPLAFLFWNSGDLIGRLLTAVPALSLTSRPRWLFIGAVSRILLVPLYLLCNINGHGAVIPSDAFYLIVVQLSFGITNGFVGSSCMMGAVEWVEVEEREAAGGFMSLCLIVGLTAGSLLSFLVADS